MNKKIGLFGGGFQHTVCSTLNKKPKYFSWDYNNNSHEITFFVDEAIIYGERHTKKKFGLLLESKYIEPYINEYCFKNTERLKLTYTNIFTHNKKLLDLDLNFYKFCPANGSWILEPKIIQKTKLISMIASNKAITEGHKKRLEVANKFQEKLDLFGRGFNPIQNKEEGLTDYMFSICIENGMYESYFTEKILDCFALGTIPIYLGTPDIFNYFNKDGIILLDDSFSISQLSKEIYESKKEAIIDNFERVQKYNTVEDWIFNNYFG